MRLHRLRFPLVLGAIALVAVGTTPAAPDPTQQVREAERAFAQTMADRDHDAFRSFLAKEAIFFGPTGAIRGAEAVSAAWKPFFAGPQAPFSWEPETVEVLESGTLAHSSGPVRLPDGTTVATFNSIWRLGSDKKWRVVFDKGCDRCAPAPAEPQEGSREGGD